VCEVFGRRVLKGNGHPEHMKPDYDCRHGKRPKKKPAPRLCKSIGMRQSRGRRPRGQALRKASRPHAIKMRRKPERNLNLPEGMWGVG
jgi:hypothetical protein